MFSRVVRRAGWRAPAVSINTYGRYPATVKEVAMDTPAFTLTSQRLGALPLIGCFAARMGLPRLLDTCPAPGLAACCCSPAWRRGTQSH